MSAHRPRTTVSVPTHLNYASVNSIIVKSISCGYGFTTFICSHHKKQRAVYGCGINSDGQLGIQVFRCLLIGRSIRLTKFTDVCQDPSILTLFLNHAKF